MLRVCLLTIAFENLCSMLTVGLHMQPTALTVRCITNYIEQGKLIFASAGCERPTGAALFESLTYRNLSPS